MIEQNDTVNLLTYIQSKRLEKDRTQIINDIERSKKNEDDAKTFTGFFKNMGRAIDRGLFSYDEKLKEIDGIIEEFNKDNPTVYTDEQAAEALPKLFENDEFGLLKLVFAARVVLDPLFTYSSIKSGIAFASNFLYGNEVELDKIKESLENDYASIYRPTLTATQKGVLSATAALALVGAFVLPVAMAGGFAASASTTTAALATAGCASMKAGIGAVTVRTIALSAALIGLSYGTMKMYNNEIAREDFANLDPDNLALHLAIQLTFVKRARRYLDDDTFKEKLDEILKALNNLRGDIDYFLFIEKKNVKDNKIKMTQFHKFEKRLYEELFENE